jgi:predicted ATP-dependent serine protease
MITSSDRDYDLEQFRARMLRETGEHLQALAPQVRADTTAWKRACEEQQQSKPEDEERLSEGRNTDSNGLSLTKLSDLLNEPEERVSWLVDKLLPSAGFSLLVAKPKAGKSTLARNLALSIAQGKDFLTRLWQFLYRPKSLKIGSFETRLWPKSSLNKATQRGAVIYLALEEKRSEVKKHFSEMGATGTEEIYVHAASAPADALEQIRAVANDKKPVLIIIDPLFRLTRVKDGNDYAQVTAALVDCSISFDMN